MQNKGTIKFFTVLLILAAVYALSFNFFTNNFEDQVLEEAKTEIQNKSEELTPENIKSTHQNLLRNYNDSAIYPVVGTPYGELKRKELNLGLDLQGGISVTLEVPTSRILTYFSDENSYAPLVKSIQEAHDQQANSQDDYMSLFAAAWEKNIAGEANPLSLKEIFNNFEFQNKFAGETDEEIIESLAKETEESIKNTQNIIRKRIDQFGVAQPNITRDNSGRIIVELPGADNRERVLKIVKQTAKLEFWDTYFANTLFADVSRADEALGRRLNPEAYEAKKEEKKDVVDAVKDAAQDVVDAVKDSTDTDEMFDLDGDDTDSNSTDELSAAEQEEQIKEAKLKNPVLGRRLGNGSAPSLGLFRVDEQKELDAFLASEEYSAILPTDLRFLWGANPTLVTLNNGESVSAVELFLIKTNDEGRSKLDGSSITDAMSGFDQYGKPEVTMQMDGPGTVIWGEMTTEAAADNNRCIAIALDNKIYSAPHVNGPITGGSSSIGMGSASTVEGKADADDLAGLLAAGSLPTKPVVVDIFEVGPTLGEANIKSGIKSFIIALILILIYLVFYYQGAGLVAGLTLLVNLVLLLGGLASLGAALTLPGIAGIVLTIGMAVDANVLIFERIREEQRHGKSLTQSVKDGYNAAYSAIIDANVTTLLTGIILFVFGSGPIKGFATTLIIGIFTSLFSAVILSKLIIYSRVDNKKSISFSSAMTKNWFANMNIPFIKNRKKYYMLSAIVVLVGLVSLVTVGLKQGIDFTGGSKYEIEFEQPVDHEKLIDIMGSAFLEDGNNASTSVTSIGTGNTNYKITTGYMIESTDENVEKLIDNAYAAGLDKTGVKWSRVSSSKITGSISNDFRTGATWATIFSLLVIFLYIIFRFKKWHFGTGALIALTHDVIIVLGLFALLKNIVPFTLEVNQAFIAAILTVVGYSINDTVVVFDRIREYLGLRRNQNREEVINSALNSTLSRTINTSLTTFLVLLMIFIFGGDDIKGFTFALMLGVIVGTYSSIFIATPAVVDLSRKSNSEE